MYVKCRFVGTVAFTLGRVIGRARLFESLAEDRMMVFRKLAYVWLRMISAEVTVLHRQAQQVGSLKGFDVGEFAGAGDK